MFINTRSTGISRYRNSCTDLSYGGILKQLSQHFAKNLNDCKDVPSVLQKDVQNLSQNIYFPYDNHYFLSISKENTDSVEVFHNKDDNENILFSKIKILNTIAQKIGNNLSIYQNL
ncbi:hypothetical protein CR513_23179, partial [Mucuna pruriens]